MIDTTLLDSTEPISMEALQVFFQANDFSTMVSRYDAEAATAQDNAFYLKVKKIFQDAWNKEMGSLTKKNSLMNFSEFYPTRCLENREEDLVSGTVMELLAEEEQCDLLLDLVFDAMQEHLRVALESHATAQGKSVDALTEEEIAFVVNQFADQFLGHMMNLLLQVQNVPEIMEMGKEMPAKEDYANHSAVCKRIKKIQKVCRAFLKERTNMAS